MVEASASGSRSSNTRPLRGRTGTSVPLASVRSSCHLLPTNLWNPGTFNKTDNPFLSLEREPFAYVVFPIIYRYERYIVFSLHHMPGSESTMN